MVRHFAKAWLAWAVVWVLLLGALFISSEGEPVCEGPLILDVADSYPPDCDDPIAGLPTVGSMLYIAGFTVTTALAAIWIPFRARRPRHA